MVRLIAFAILLMPAVASAEQAAPQRVHEMHEMRHSTPMTGAPLDLAQMGNVPMNRMPMNHTQMMDHDRMMHGASTALTNSRQAPSVLPTQPGQSAFAAIQEIVAILQTDPRTDWSKVDIEALRQHLIDMTNVTLAARVASEAIDGGVRFVVTGDGAVRDSIRRMTSAHAAIMDGVGGWHFAAKDTEDGAIFNVRVPPQEMVKLKALGFIGILTVDMHHQEHHLMIARGEHPHH